MKAGIFNHAEELGDEGSRECLRKEDTVDISSENSRPLISRSEDDVEGDDDEDDDNDRDNKKKRRKKYHRHTAEQIREMEAYVNVSHLFHSHKCCVHRI